MQSMTAHGRAASRIVALWNRSPAKCLSLIAFMVSWLAYNAGVGADLDRCISILEADGSVH